MDAASTPHKYIQLTVVAPVPAAATTTAEFKSLASIGSHCRKLRASGYKLFNYYELTLTLISRQVKLWAQGERPQVQNAEFTCPRATQMTCLSDPIMLILRTLSCVVSLCSIAKLCGAAFMLSQFVGLGGPTEWLAGELAFGRRSNGRPGGFVCIM